MEAQNGGSSPGSSQRRRRGRKSGGQDVDSLAMPQPYHGGGNRGSPSHKGSFTKDVGVVHHHPPKEMVADVGYPVRGGQTLLIAYFPWEASEADIEQEFSKFSRVKRVHLVVDKSSRKPRCFGFVKFHTKEDADQALHATMLGLVQLSDTRGHVWHLKAEWTKSGDMVVDDSETEQEVAKRKEERRVRPDSRTVGEGGGSKNNVHSSEGRSKNTKWLHSASTQTVKSGPSSSSVPAPLPPLQPRYPLQPLGPHMPMVQPGQPAPGMPPAPPLLPPGGQMGAGPPQQHVYGNPPGGVQQSLPLYSGYGQSPAPPLYPGYPPPVPSSLSSMAVPPRGPPPAQAADIAAPGGLLPQPPLRDLLGGSSGYGAPHAYAPPQGSYPPQLGGFGAPPPPQSGYVGQPGAYAGQAPYPSQLAAAAAASYAGQQAAYAAAGAPQAPYPGSPQGYAAAPPPTYPPAYPPQHAPYPPPQPSIPSQSGYAPPPPNYASQAYTAQQVASQPPPYAASPYAGVIQPNLPPHAVPPPPGPYNYQMPSHHPTATVADASYPGHMPPATGLQPHPVHGQVLEEAPQHPPVLHSSPASAGAVYGSPEMSGQVQDPAVLAAMATQQLNGVQSQMVMIPSMQNVHHNGVQQSPPPSVQDTASQQPDSGDLSAAVHNAGTSMTQVAPSPSAMSGTSNHEATAAEQEYLDHQLFMHFPDMDIHEKNAATAMSSQPAMPAPPSQQPPAPPAQGVGQWQTEPFRENAIAPSGPSQPQSLQHGQSNKQPRPGRPAALWNAFDDAAAKGLVDGLVGDDGIPPPGWASAQPQHLNSSANKIT